MIKKFLIFNALLIFIINVNAQAVFKLMSENSKLIIAGTSSIHDWEMEANNFDCEIILLRDENNITTIRQIEFACPVAEITSKYKIMDNKTYKALKDKQHPEIKFLSHQNQDIKLSGNEVLINGLLTVAGKTREIEFLSFLVSNSENSFTASGAVPINMSDYNIEPPTAMLGALKTGEEVVVKFIFEFIISSHELTRSK